MIPMKKNKLQKILSVLSPDETSVDFKVFDEQVSKLKSQLKEKINIKTLEDVNGQLDKFKKRIDLDPLLETSGRIEQTFTDRTKEIESELESRTSELGNMFSESDKVSGEKLAELIDEIGELKTKLGGLGEAKKTDIETLNKTIKELEDTSEEIEQELEDLNKTLSGDLKKGLADNKGKAESKSKEIEDKLDATRKDLLSKIASIGGGSMNRKITFGGTDYLTRYTDINYKPGPNVTFTMANNDQTKMVDVTIDSTATGGSVRSINSVSTSQGLGNAVGTDYVYLCTGTIVLTLPTATLNSCLYTIKNVGTGVVTVDTTSSQTIDGDLTIIMPVRYTSVDIISDTANWNIT